MKIVRVLDDLQGFIKYLTRRPVKTKSMTFFDATKASGSLGSNSTLIESTGMPCFLDLLLNHLH